MIQLLCNSFQTWDFTIWYLIILFLDDLRNSTTLFTFLIHNYKHPMLDWNLMKLKLELKDADMSSAAAEPQK